MNTNSHPVVLIFFSLSEEAEVVPGNEEFVKLFLLVEKLPVRVRTLNTIACDYLKHVISEALLNKENIGHIKLEAISTNFSSYVSDKMKENLLIVLEKAGPSLNIKITSEYYINRYFKTMNLH